MATYEEAEELTKYVWKYCQSLMTEVERRADRAILGRAKADGAMRCGSLALAQALMESWGCPGDSDVEELLAKGADAFRRSVVQRLLAHPEFEGAINRCPRCRRIVRTPRAKQCLWCGNDWHAPPTCSE